MCVGISQLGYDHYHYRQKDDLSRARIRAKR